ncbi:MAG: transposase [Bryobacteraceae bacterium]|nr:transposase [Bryobacteraceae bacterium]
MATLERPSIAPDVAVADPAGCGNPVAVEVAEGLSHGFGPAHSGSFHAVFDQILTGSFDRAAGNGPAVGKVFVVAHVGAPDWTNNAEFASKVQKLRQRFGLSDVVLVGDRGMITSARIREDLPAAYGIQWISALRPSQIQKLATRGHLQMSLFDRTDLVEIAHPDFPGERLMACFNPLLSEERARKRPDLHYRRKTANIEREQSLDGIYVIRTSVPQQALSSQQVVASYKGLSGVQRAFRSLKSVDLHVRPIHHRLPDRVRAHILPCMLAYYVEWHMRQRLAPMLFDDDDKPQAQAARRSIVAPAKELRPRSGAGNTNSASKCSSQRSPSRSSRKAWSTDLRDIASSRSTGSTLAASSTGPRPKRRNKVKGLVSARDLNDRSNRPTALPYREGMAGRFPAQ